MLDAENQVIIYSKPGCCLCDKAKEQLRLLHEKRSFDCTEVNILEDPEAFAQFADEIPVIFVNGREACRHHLDESRFVKLLR
ncbi:MAG: glutaredoxin family protein [Terriglobia bacterium]